MNSQFDSSGKDNRKLEREFEAIRKSQAARLETFGKVQGEIFPEGRRVKISELVNQQIYIRSLSQRKWDGKPYFHLVIADSQGEIMNCNVYASPLASKISARSNRLPFPVVIVAVQDGDGYFHYDIE